MPWVKDIEGQDKQYTYFTDALKVCKIKKLVAVVCKSLEYEIDICLANKCGYIDVYAFEDDNCFSLLFSHLLTQSKFARKQKIRYFKVCRTSMPEKDIRAMAFSTRRYLNDARIKAEINILKLVLIMYKFTDKSSVLLVQ